MSRIHKLLFLLSAILSVFLLLTPISQNLVKLAYLPASQTSKGILNQPSSESCRETWLRTAAASADPAYFIPPKDVTAILDCGSDYVSLLSAIQPNNYEDASLAVAQYPDEPAAWFWQGETTLASIPQTALQSFTHVVQLQPANGVAWCRLGLANEKTGQFLPAADAYLRCCQNGDPNVAGCYGAGRMEEKLGNLRQAIVDYRQSRAPRALKRADVLESQLGPTQ